MSKRYVIDSSDDEEEDVKIPEKRYKRNVIEDDDNYDDNKFNLNRNYRGDRMFTWGFEWEPSNLHYFSSEKLRDRQKIKIEDEDEDDIVKGLMSAEIISVQDKKCSYNIELALGVFSYSSIDVFLMDSTYELFRKSLSHFQEKWIKFVLGSPQFRLYTNKGGELSKYCDPSIDLYEQYKRGYQRSITLNDLETVEGNPQMTIGIPLEYASSFMEKSIEKLGKMGLLNDCVRTNHLLSILFSYSYKDLTYDELIDKTYLKTLFTYKPRSNVAVMFEYLLRKDPTIMDRFNRIYEKLYQLADIERIPFFDDVKTENQLYYARIYHLFKDNDKVVQKLNELSETYEITYENFLYLFRRYARKLNRDDIEDLEDNTEIDTKVKVNVEKVLCMDVMYMIRQLINSFYKRYVTRVELFNPEFINENEIFALNGYLFDIPKEDLEEYIREGSILKCTTDIPYCHTEDAPFLYKENGFLTANNRLEIFEWIPENENVIFEIRNPNTFVKKQEECLQKDCLEDLLIECLEKIKKEIKDKI